MQADKVSKQTFGDKCAEKIDKFCTTREPMTIKEWKSGVAKLIDDQLRPCAQEAAEKIANKLRERQWLRKSPGYSEIPNSDLFHIAELVADIILNSFNKKEDL